MILKKPYAFLIKNFKLIHILLTGLYIYLAFYVSSISNFYIGFIEGSKRKLDAISYISNTPYIVIILSLIICLILFILMNYKKKPKLLYLILSLLYIVVFGIIFITTNGLNIIYNNILETKTLLFYSDLLRIIILFQYGSIVMTTVRAIGFDIKKFNFREDIHELDIDITDDEEVELVMGVNKHKLTQRINRRKRELKYYFAENKIFILLTIGILIFLSISTITIDKKVVNKIYKQNETFSSDNFNIKITDSYITNKSYNGNTLSTENIFVVVNLEITPKKTSTSLNTSNLILKTNNNSYTITKKYYNYFKDIGVGYKDQNINSAKKYIFVYQISKEEIDEDKHVIYTGSTNELKVNLSPKNLDINNENKEYKLTENIDFTDSTISSSNFQINKYEINNKFTYNYTFTINDKEHTSNKYITSPDNTILYLELTSSFSMNTTNYDFIKDYGSIKYSINNTEYTTKKLADKTPGGYEKGIYLEVDKNMENAENIWIELNVRNIKYKYILK